MALETNLNTSPYFDDFNVANDFYRILFRPGVAVQARELTQAQTILQDQIYKFGKHVFKEGSVIEGCSFTFNDKYHYVKLLDNLVDGTAFDVTNYVGNGYVVRNDLGLEATILNAVEGYETTAPDLKTLYINYTNSVVSNGQNISLFQPTDILTIYDSSNTAIGQAFTVASVDNAVGNGYAFTTTEGVIFKKGFFVRVNPETIIVDKYHSSPDSISIGFSVTEEIVTPEIDGSLLDNAAGSRNYAAPGAHRLRLTTGLIVRSTVDAASDTDFFSIVDFKLGNPISIKNDPQYSELGKQLAKRTYEESGNYVVKPFTISTSELAANTTHFRVDIGPGLAYIQGYRNEITNKTYVTTRKGTDKIGHPLQPISANFGYYVKVKDFAGEFRVDQIDRIELHNDNYGALTNKAFTDVSYSSTQKIGTAYVRGMAYDSGTPGTPDCVYRLYLFNIVMNKGRSFSDVKSFVAYSSPDVIGVADAVLENGFSVIKESSLNTLIFPFGQKAISPDGFSDLEYAYRNRLTGDIGTDGTATFTLGTVVGSAEESFSASGTLSNALETDFIIVAADTGFTGNKDGTAQYANNGFDLVGSSTHFTTDYAVGDYIYINSLTRQIAKITDDTNLTVDTAFPGTGGGSLYVHKKTFPVGASIPVSTRDDRTITISTDGLSATLDINDSISSSFPVSIYHTVLRANTYAAKKVIKRNRLVKIDCATHANGAAGPWDLGVTDLFRINKVYINSAATYEDTVGDSSNKFVSFNGQRDTYYDHATLAKSTISPPYMTSDATLLVDLDYFIVDNTQGVGFFTSESYPIDDANTANTAAITTQEIPVYTSTNTTQIYNLRDSIDYRPSLINTAVDTQVIADATINPAVTSVMSVLGTGSFLPSPDSVFKSTNEHYLSRIDKVVMSANGAIYVLEGEPSDRPIEPREKNGDMSLATVYIPPYPTLIYTQMRSLPRANRNSDYVTIQPTQNKRYTMRDIKTIDQRVEALEYYTALTLLEKKATDLVVRDDQGNDRFKNGFLVDPFDDHTIGNTKSREYACSIDAINSEMRPKFIQTTSGSGYRPNDVETTNVTRKGYMTTLTSETVEYIQQPYASKKRNCVEGNVYTYTGSVKLTPDVDVSPDIGGKTEVVTPAATEFTNLIDKPNSLSMNYNNWIGTNRRVDRAHLAKTLANKI